MKIDCKCKVCGIKLIVEIDDDYAKENDPYRLIPMATCNRCYDYRIERDQLKDAIGRVCMAILAKNGKHTPAMRESLVILTKKYAVMVQRYWRYPTIMWDEEFVNLLIEKPDKFFPILAQYRIQARENARRKPQEATV